MDNPGQFRGCKNTQEDLPHSGGVVFPFSCLSPHLAKAMLFQGLEQEAAADLVLPNCTSCSFLGLFGLFPWSAAPPECLGTILEEGTCLDVGQNQGSAHFWPLRIRDVLHSSSPAML